MSSRRLRSRRSRQGLEAALDGAAEHPLFPLLFDEAWYLARYPDVLNSDLDGAQHFLSSGAFEWRNPSPYVDLRFAAEALPASARDGSAIVLHLLESGLSSGVPTSPYVDLDWFGRRHELSAASPAEQFHVLVVRGRAERLDPSPWIDLTWYASAHPEMSLGGLEPFEYFLSVGRWLQRFPHPAWDEDRYLAVNDYVRTAVGSGKYSSGFEHFCAAGWSEASREAIALPLRIADRHDEFSESRYLAANADVRKELAAKSVRSGLEHLMTDGHRSVTSGARQMKHPSPFSTATICATDVPAAGHWLVLLNHFDLDEVVDRHVICSIDAYRKAGADVVLITTGADTTEIEDHVTAVVTKSRNDDLRDFGGWHHALRLLGGSRLERYSRVILANDSTYFPVVDPTAFFQQLEGSQADLFAATDSVSGGRYHLQSYFLALGPHALRTLLPELDRRIAQQVEATKMTLIQRFEVGLSEFAHMQGLTSEVYFRLSGISDLAAALSPPDRRPISRLAATVMNLTHHCWRASLLSGLPFLKVELLRDNPVGVDIGEWSRVVDGACSAELIEAHLARTRR